MHSGMWKITFREIKRTLGRYLTIFAIIALGVGFVVGLKMTRPVMVATVSDYVSDQNLYDYELLSTLGFTEDDVEVFARMSDVRAVEGSISTDVLYVTGEDELALTFLSITDGVNESYLVAGRMPEEANECVVDSRLMGEDDIGSTIQVAENNDEDTLELLVYDEYEVVGIIENPLYLNFERGTTSVGSGQLSGYVFLPEDGFDTDYYTEIYIRYDQDYEIYSDEYEDFLDAHEDEVDEILTARVQLRYNTVVAEAESEIADAEDELADGESELADAKKELADGESELADAESELIEGESELEDAIAQLEEAESEIADSKKELEEGESELEAQKADYEVQFADAQAQLDEAQAEIEEQESELAAAEAQVAEAESEIAENEALLNDSLLELADAQTTITEASEELAAQKETLEASSEELATQEATLNASAEELAETKELLAAQRAELTAAQETLATQKTELEAAKTELTEALELAQTQLAVLQASISTAESDGSENDTATGDSYGSGAAESGSSESDIATSDLYSSSVAQDDSDSNSVTESTSVTGSRSAVVASDSDNSGDSSSAEIDNDSSSAESGSDSSSVETQIATLTAQIEQLQQSLEQVEAGLAEVAAMETTLAASDEELTAAEAQVASGEEELAAGQSQLAAAKEELAAGQTQIAEAEEELETSQAQVTAGKQEAEAGLAQIESAKEELATQSATLADARKQLEEGKETLAASLEEYEEGVASYNKEIAEAEETLADARGQIADAEEEVEEGWQEVYDSQDTIEEGWQELEDGRKELEDGYQEIADAEEELADGYQEVADAKEELANLEAAQYLLGRDSNVGYVSFESDSMIVDNVANVFPVFFFLVAILICITTMNRMVDEGRTQIGVLKALGYNKSAIAWEYIFYSTSAALVGGLIGFAFGSIVFPIIIWAAYGIMYDVAGLHLVFSVGWLIFAIVTALVCSVGATMFSCYVEFASVPANLMRPRSPQSGKRVFMEYITPIWKHLSFLQKVSIRNVLRYKKRFLMMVLGVSGCTALLLAAGGLKDSCVHIADSQYDQIQTYDIEAVLDDGADASLMEELRDNYGDSIDEMLFLCEDSVDLVTEDLTKEVTAVVAADESQMDDFWKLFDSKGNAIAYPGESEAVVTKKTASKLKVSVGDTLTVRNDEGKTVTVTVTGIAVNYVYNYIYLSQETWENGFGVQPEYKYVCMQVAEDADIYEAAAAVSNDDEVLQITVTQDNRQRISNMMDSLDAVVALVFACAAALAFIVMYNLTNINIIERVREIATIKVLGFYPGETAQYVFRENLMLTLIGTVIGLGLGVWLHAFIMACIDVDFVTFDLIITAKSYVTAVLLTLLFAVIVDVVMYFKLDKINMAESLKSIE